MGKQSQIGDALIAPIKSPKALWEIKRGRGDTSKELEVREGSGKCYDTRRSLRAGKLEKLETALENVVVPIDHRDSSR